MPGSSERDMKHIFGAAIEAVNRRLRDSEAEAQRPTSHLFRCWLAQRGAKTFMAYPMARPAATEEEIVCAEARLGFRLPLELREAYTVSNGARWAVPPGEKLLALQGQFPALENLVLAGQLQPPMSVLTERYWREEGRDDDEPPHVVVQSPGPISHIVEVPERSIEFSDLDQFLALQIPPATSCLLMSVNKASGFPVGTVLEVESNIASRFESLNHWLASELD